MNARICIPLIVLVLVAATTALAVEPPKIVKLSSDKQGTVLFHHEEHLVAVNDCTDCHHMGVEAGACRGCHGVDRMIPRLKHAFHRQCRNCHIKDSGPTECNDCHKKK